MKKNEQMRMKFENKVQQVNKEAKKKNRDILQKHKNLQSKHGEFEQSKIEEISMKKEFNNLRKLDQQSNLEEIKKKR